jgi:hypothetical protein
MKMDGGTDRKVFPGHSSLRKITQTAMSVPLSRVSIDDVACKVRELGLKASPNSALIGPKHDFSLSREE